jgi:signal transduction histidine kinase
MGMAEADLNELLAYTPRRRNKAKRKSTGFGVPIAKRYIEAHGGTLTFESREDEGTAVLIDLPRQTRSSHTTHDSGESE